MTPSTGQDRAAPQPNGCICDMCPATGAECTNVAPDGEDICDECSMGVHEGDRRDDD